MCRNMRSTRARGERHSGRHLMRTMRVGVHQGEDGDVQRVPQLPHHQPAVHIRDAFSLGDTGHRASRFPLHGYATVRSGLSRSFFVLATDGILRNGIQMMLAHTVIMMQGDSFAQKSSSSSLWNVASFSTIRTNLAEEATSAR